MGTYVIMGLAVAFNILIVLWKLTHKRILDGFVDGALLVVVAMIFSASLGALMMGTVGSFIVSVYLYFCPIRFNNA